MKHLGSEAPVSGRRRSAIGVAAGVRRARLQARQRTAASFNPEQADHAGPADPLAAVDNDRLVLAEKQLAIERERLALSARAGHFGIWDFDIEANELNCDDGWYQILGIDPSRPVKTIEDFRPYIHPDDAELATRVDKVELANLLAEHKDYTNAFRIIRPSGEIRWVISAACLLEDAGVPGRAVGVITDVTEKRFVEQSLREEMSALERTVVDLVKARLAAEAAKQARDELLASVSHEIRTPLSGIVGVLAVLEREQLSAEARELLREARACGDMLRQLVNNVLDHAQLEAGKMDVASEPVNMVEVVAGVVRLLMPEAQQKRIYLREDIDADIGWVIGDPLRIRQCLFNLVGNAIKFTAEGGVRIRVCSGGAARVRVEVEDTGAGISERDQQRLFRRFEQVGTDRAERLNGAGLGLSITKQLAQLMGGDIGLSSREHVGSTFWLEFDAPVATAPEASPVAPVSMERLRILVADDNPRGLAISTPLLQSLGATVVSAGSGSEAIALVRRRSFDVILMDINMPDMNGVEAALRIRALTEFDMATTSIVALTADTLSGERAGGLNAVFDAAVLKPFDPAGLSRTISDVRAAKARAREDGV